MIVARAFRGFRFPAEVILWAVRWYLQFPISYRDLEAMLADRDVEVDHTTMYRWVQRFAPEPACCTEVGGTVGSGAVLAARVLSPCRTRPMPAAVIISLGRSGG